MYSFDRTETSVWSLVFMPLRMQAHTFRRPNKPLAPPTPRASVLGLDRLAQEKRAAAAAANGEGSRKKARLDDDGDEPHFKGTSAWFVLTKCWDLTKMQCLQCLLRGHPISGNEVRRPPLIPVVCRTWRDRNWRNAGVPEVSFLHARSAPVC